MPAGPCQTVAGGVCGAGSGVISSVSGDVSLGRGGAVNPIGGGAAIFGGDRILARAGTARVSLGPTCFVCVGPNAISVVTQSQQNGLTCLSNAEGCLVPPVPVAGAAFDPTLVAAGILAAGIGAGIGIAVSQPGPSVSP